MIPKPLLIFLLCITLNCFSQPVFKTDMLGEPFESAVVAMPDDYEGKVICTLVHRNESTRNYAAVLYVNGYNDYFFNTELAENFHNNGITFYALDLRKYGRSILPNQKPGNVRDLAEYDADLDTALKLIKSFGHTRIILAGHDLGGLIISLYAAKNNGKENFDALICNSPFYDFNVSFLKKNMGIPLISHAGKNHPDKIKNIHYPELYSESIHKSKQGNWDYDLSLKPLVPLPPNKGWIRAVHLAQKQLKNGITISKPVFIMHAEKSVYENKWSDKLFTADAVLNVNDMHNGFEKIKAVKIELAFKNGMHDLFLSKPDVEKAIYHELFVWIEKYF